MASITTEAPPSHRSQSPNGGSAGSLYHCCQEPVSGASRADARDDGLVPPPYSVPAINLLHKHRQEVDTGMRTAFRSATRLNTGAVPYYYLERGGLAMTSMEMPTSPSSALDFDSTDPSDEVCMLDLDAAVGCNGSIMAMG